MLTKLELNFKKNYLTISALMTIVVALRCYFVPFAHDEVANFLYYLQPGQFAPFSSHVDAMNHFLNNAFTWPCYKLFGSSVFVLRLPNLFAFIILCYGTFKLTQLVNSIFSKYILVFGFIVSYHFVAFYSLSRGYGLSMAFLVLALYYFFVSIQSYTFKNFSLFLISAHLALSANLTLVFVLLITSSVLIVFQIINKQFFKFKTILLWLISFSLILFWIKYAFYLQNNGALYYGSGESYWQVTFVSLITTLFFESFILNILVLISVAILFFYWLYAFRQQGVRFALNSRFAISFFILIILILVFYLLKLILHVNYPEDRTGLFFYVFFIITLSFKVDETRYTYQKFTLVFPIFMLIHFFSTVSFVTHPWRIYETIPERFIKTLIQEQEKSNQKITIAGHRMREFIYGFMNYNQSQKLNHITSPEALQMNADYAIAYKADQPYYKRLYNEIDAEDKWNFVLLKRKEKIERQLIYQSSQATNWQGESEYFNAFEKLDTTFNFPNPILAEFNLSFIKVPVPFNAWLVLQIDDANQSELNALVRVPLNLIQKDLNSNVNQTIHVLSGNFPLKIKRVVCYLWNIDKKSVQIKVNSFKLFRLNGRGIDIISQAKF